MGSSQIAFSLSTENGTTLCDGKYTEGDVQRKLLNVGRMARLTIVVNKRQYLPDSRKCRHKPYAEILNENVLKNIYNRCPVPCKPADTKFDYCQALRMSKEIDQLPNSEKIPTPDAFKKVMTLLKNTSGTSLALAPNSITKLRQEQIHYHQAMKQGSKFTLTLQGLL